MPDTPLPIANGFYVSDSLPISGQECVNWYVNIVEAPALNQETLFGTPGKVQLATSGPDSNRGSLKLGDVPYFVNGQELFREESDFTLTTIGSIEGSGRVSMASNGTQLMILVPGGAGYIFTTNTGHDLLTEITATGFRASGNPQHVKYAKSFFVVTTDTKRFITSGVNDGLSWLATDFGTAEADPDPIVAPIVINNQLFIGGSETIEGFQPITGTADFAFQASGLVIQKGIKAPFSIVNANNTFMFIGGDKDESPAIWQLEGNSVVKISTTAIDSILQGFTEAEIAEAFAYSYAQKGAYFVAFSLPTTTLVIDTITNRWGERKSQVIDPITGEVLTLRDRTNSLVTAYGKVLVGDSVDGRIGELDPDAYTEYGSSISRVIATQPFQNNMNAFFVPSIELTMEAGVGNSEAPNPKIRMDRSTDGGKTFSYERIRSIGKVGEYRKRSIWRKNGRASRFEVFRWTMSDAVKPVIIQLTAQIEASV